MMRRVFIAWMLVAVPVKADSFDAGYQAYRLGDFNQARLLFQQADSAEGFAWACRTGLIIGGFFDPPAEGTRSLHRALDDCNAALSLDPDHIDARISLAVAIGFEAQRTRKASYANRSRAILEEVADETDGYGVLEAALGGWHAAVSKAGFMARVVLGASKKKADTYLSRAIMLMPTDVGVRYEYVKFLAAASNKKTREDAAEEIDTLLTLTPTDALGRLLQQKTMSIKRALDTGNKKEARAAVRAATAFNGIEAYDEVKAYELDQ